MEELKNCPFCGGEVEYVNRKYRNKIESTFLMCRGDKCDASIGKGSRLTRDEARKAWNRRA